MKSSDIEDILVLIFFGGVRSIAVIYSLEQEHELNRNKALKD